MKTKLYALLKFLEPVLRLLRPFTEVKPTTVIVIIVIEAFAALLLWQLTAVELITKPTEMFSFLKAVYNDPTSHFMENLVLSLTLTIKGMGISMVIATVVAYMSLIPLFTPIANFLIKCRYLTLTGLNFTFFVLADDAATLKLALLVFGIVPFFLTSFMSIIDSIPTQEYELCKTLRMNSWQTLWEVVIVGRLDQVIEVMRQNFAIAWMMITTVEGLNLAGGGLGTMFEKFRHFNEQGKMYALLLVIFVLGIFFDYILGVIRHWLFPYTKLQVRK